MVINHTEWFCISHLSRSNPLLPVPPQTTIDQNNLRNIFSALASLGIPWQELSAPHSRSMLPHVEFSLLRDGLGITGKSSDADKDGKK